MSELKITGTIEHIMYAKEGVAKSGKNWKAVEFIVKTEDEYNNLYCFKKFGSGEKIKEVDDFLKWNKVNDLVEVFFNIETRQFEERYFTNLSAWKVMSSKFGESAEKLKAISNESQTKVETISDESEDDLPF